MRKWEGGGDNGEGIKGNGEGGREKGERGGEKEEGRREKGGGTRCGSGSGFLNFSVMKDTQKTAKKFASQGIDQGF